MGVYIKNMEMPKSCMECKLTDSEYCTCVAVNFWEDEYYVGKFTHNRAPWCPLVPVPPHGRLGDLDALMARLEKYHPPLDIAMRELADAPTIVPAEESET